ncbi:DnaJ domain-containing protein [Paraurantiacibacter namhicola]|uniref:DnaJ domain protein n=1 Tax=Paraurantiacibacter namhicola TaxID=645517 RepID=A0A1C7D5A4_9SPHN|nr:DnaJ domain-containing protein [Paraurantiacibacter namhicola]ANU06640.1 DnaJ domain protein [Paraurantiacibacter namhicola]
MLKLLILAAIICVGWKMALGRWPWQKQDGTRQQALFRARKLLGVPANARHQDIIEAHRRLITMVHPDRGGSNAQVHEANDARDLLLNELPDRSTHP